MSEWSGFHYRDKGEPKGIAVEPAEMIRKELTYRGFLPHRTDPKLGHMWRIADLDRREVAGLGGAFTNYRLAQDAVDRMIEDRRRKEENPN